MLTADKGLNRFTWDLRYPGMERFDNLVMWSDMREGPKAVPGRYRAELTVGDQVQDVSFDVIADPRSQASDVDYQARNNFV